MAAPRCHSRPGALGGGWEMEVVRVKGEGWGYSWGHSEHTWGLVPSCSYLAS